ncbi:MAG: hypothetical protein ABSF03_16745 [Streptosporangiaceae bacterium]
MDPPADHVQLPSQHDGRAGRPPQRRDRDGVHLPGRSGRRRNRRGHRAAGPRRLVRAVTAAALGAPLLAVAGPLALFLPPATGAHAVALSAVARTPALTISVADGRHTVKPGDLLSYTVRIRDTGTAGAPGLDIVQTLPPGMTLTSVSPKGAAHDGHVTWQVNLAAGGEDTFHVAGRAGPEPPQLLRLATIACASTRGSVRPIVCAAHLDQLPAQAPRATATAAGGRPTGYVRPLAVTLVLAVAAAAAACGRWLVLRRRARGAP